MPFSYLKPKAKKDWYDKFWQALCYFALEEVGKGKELYEETISQCDEQEALEHGLANLKELMELLGNSLDAKEIVALFNVKLDKQ